MPARLDRILRRSATPVVTVHWFNASGGTLTDADAALIVAALNAQNPDLVKAWGPQAKCVHVLSTGQKIRASETVRKAWWLPNADVAGALGYHANDPDGDPYTKVFVETILANGGTVLTGAVSVSVASSHEACEMAVDPSCARQATAPDGKVWALEVGDPVESTSYDKMLPAPSIGKGVAQAVAVSDFAFPAFFTPGATGPYDRCNVVSAPFTLAPGGYAVEDGQEVFADGYAEWRKPGKLFPASRTARRLAQAR